MYDTDNDKEPEGFPQTQIYARFYADKDYKEQLDKGWFNSLQEIYLTVFMLATKIGGPVFLVVGALVLGIVIFGR